MLDKKNKKSNLQGITHLIKEAIIGITDLVEEMQERIVHPPFLPSTPIQHIITNISKVTYKNIRWSTHFFGNGIDKLLGKLTPLFGEIKTTKEKEVVRSVLNGIIGDYLEKEENPLQIIMQFRHQEKTLSLDNESLKKSYPAINGKILLMVHGSCMSDIQWTKKGNNHSEVLAEELHKTPIYLLYNSGRHISLNGQCLNKLLEELVLNWSVPVEELIIIAHSMGGLITRSALYYGQQQEKKWTKHLKKIVFLGTPHHGASLERAGNYLDVILEAIPYTKPFARLGKIRSAGVTDLRYGNLIHEDWQDNDRFKLQADQRKFIPLPKGITCFSIAACSSKALSTISAKFIGDKLVSINSALGQHKDPTKSLNFKKKNTWIAYENTHTDLLYNPEIYVKIKEWLV
ncbi:MAG: pimeloyl-ACP methyl ester carboxylesterase [Porticoccaceae bacterium]|jgi:pimeloyl-ACP methyl ester carboxylesterase